MRYVYQYVVSRISGKSELRGGLVVVESELRRGLVVVESEVRGGLMVVESELPRGNGDMLSGW